MYTKSFISLSSYPKQKEAANHRSDCPFWFRVELEYTLTEHPAPSSPQHDWHELHDNSSLYSCQRCRPFYDRSFFQDDSEN